MYKVNIAIAFYFFADMMGMGYRSRIFPACGYME